MISFWESHVGLTQGTCLFIQQVIDNSLLSGDACDTMVSESGHNLCLLGSFDPVREVHVNLPPELPGKSCTHEFNGETNAIGGHSEAWRGGDQVKLTRLQG